MRGKNIDFQVALFKNLMRRNYDLSGNELDLYALVDPKLTTIENWNILKPMVILLCNKTHKDLFK